MKHFDALFRIAYLKWVMLTALEQSMCAGVDTAKSQDVQLGLG